MENNQEAIALITQKMLQAVQEQYIEQGYQDGPLANNIEVDVLQKYASTYDNKGVSKLAETDTTILGLISGTVINQCIMHYFMTEESELMDALKKQIDEQVEVVSNFTDEVADKHLNAKAEAH